MDIQINRKRTRTSSGKRVIRVKTTGAYSGTGPRRADVIVTAGRRRMAPLRTGGFYGLWNGRRADELKTIDSTATTDIPTAGLVNTISGVAAGTDYNNRIGRKIMMKSLLLRFALSPIATASAPIGDVVRIIVFYDTQTNGVLPTIAQLLQNSQFDDPLNLDNRDRFRVIMDKYIGMPASAYTAGALTAGSPTPKTMTKYRKFRLEGIFSGTTAAVGSIATGGIFIAYLSRTNTVTNITWDARIRFVDN